MSIFEPEHILFLETNEIKLFVESEFLQERISYWITKNKITKENYQEKFCAENKLFEKFEKYMKSLEEENLIERTDLRKAIHKNYGNIKSWVTQVLNYKKIIPEQTKDSEHFDYCLLVILI